MCESEVCTDGQGLWETAGDFSSVIDKFWLHTYYDCDF